MIYNLNKKAYEVMYGKGKAEAFYEGAKIALRQVEVPKADLIKHFKGLTIKSEAKLFTFGQKYIGQITNVMDSGSTTEERHFYSGCNNARI